MQVPDAVLARDLVSDYPADPLGVPGLPPRVSPERLRNLAASASLAGGEHETMAVRAPFTGRAVGEVWAGDEGDVRRAFERARQAQGAWAARPVRERAAVLLRYHDLVLRDSVEVLDLIQMEAGKARIDAFAEVADVALVARYYGVHGPKYLGAERRRGFLPGLTQVRVHHPPKGVVGIIAPWNYPLTMAISDALPALLAGNAVVLKPAEQTPFTALWAARKLFEAGLPPELLHVVPGRGETLGPALVAEADFVHFTGSTEVGRKIGEQAGEALTGCSLELGGKNPLIVRHDADLDRAAEGIRQACFSSAGQLCVSAERLLVHESVLDAFLARFVESVEVMEVNARYDFSAHLGSLVSEEQMQKVEAHVADAVERGASVVTGGRRLPEVGPLFYAPTVLVGVQEGMTLFQEETFGPVVSVYPFRTDEEAVARANASAYGLHASVWTRDVAAGRRLARRIECGTVSINDGFAATWASTATPMGGFKQSGLGRRHGPEGLLKYTEAQTVAAQHGLPIAPLPGMPQGQYAALVQGALRLIRHVPGLR